MMFIWTRILRIARIFVFLVAVLKICRKSIFFLFYGRPCGLKITRKSVWKSFFPLLFGRPCGFKILKNLLKIYLNTNHSNDANLSFFLGVGLVASKSWENLLEIFILCLNTDCSNNTNLSLILGVGLTTSKSLENLLENSSLLEHGLLESDDFFSYSWGRPYGLKSTRKSAWESFFLLLFGRPCGFKILKNLLKIYLNTNYSNDTNLSFFLGVVLADSKSLENLLKISSLLEHGFHDFNESFFLIAAGDEWWLLNWGCMTFLFFCTTKVSSVTFLQGNVFWKIPANQLRCTKREATIFGFAKVRFFLTTSKYILTLLYIQENTLFTNYELLTLYTGYFFSTLTFCLTHGHGMQPKWS